MSNITIDNEKQLREFLEIVAQESVKKSLRESDMHVEKYKEQRKEDLKMFKSN